MKRYVGHLYNLLKGRVDLFALSDIVDFRGDMVFASGDRIVEAQYLSASKMRLKEPLSESVVICDLQSGTSLYASMLKLVENDSSFLSIDHAHGYSSVLQACCKKIQQYENIQEIMTLFNWCRPKLYEQSLYCAYLAYICGMSCKYSQEKIESAFLAGLLHDIGLLFIDHKILDKNEKLTAEEWDKIKLHPIVAYKIVSIIPEFPVCASHVILDHHENADGSGYCRGKEEEHISDITSLISLIDDLAVIYVNKFKPINRTLSDVIPILQMNTHGYPRSIISSVLSVLKCVEESTFKPIDEKTLKELIEHTYQQQCYIERFVDLMEKINKEINPKNATKEVVKLQKLWNKLSVNIASSGIQNSSYVDWLIKSEGSNKKELYMEVENVRLMLQEVVYQINNYFNFLNSCLSDGMTDHVDDFKLFVHVYSVTAMPSTPSSLRSYWEML